MVRTGRLLYVHMPKTGGTYACKVLREQLYARPFNGKGGHWPACKATEEERGDRTVFGSARNPWDWYASWYIHTMNNNQRQRAALELWGGGSAAWRDVLYGVTHPWERPEVPEAPGVIWKPIAGGEAVRRHRVGLFTWAVRYMFGTAEAAAEGVDDWAVHALIDGTQPDAGLAVVAGTSPAEPTNTRRHRGVGRFQGPEQYSDWYDDESYGWVAEADAGLIELLGYPGPHLPAERAVTWLQARPSAEEAA